MAVGTEFTVPNWPRCPAFCPLASIPPRKLLAVHGVRRASGMLACRSLRGNALLAASPPMSGVLRRSRRVRSPGPHRFHPAGATTAGCRTVRSLRRDIQRPHPPAKAALREPRAAPRVDCFHLHLDSNSPGPLSCGFSPVPDGPFACCGASPAPSHESINGEFQCFEFPQAPSRPTRCFTTSRVPPGAWPAKSWRRQCGVGRLASSTA